MTPGVERVLFMTNAYPEQARPWFGVFVSAQAAALRQLGVAVDVEVARGHRGKREYAACALRALSLTRHRPYDIVHAHYGLMGVVARAQLRIPLVVTFVGSDLQGDVDADGRPTRAGALESWLSRTAARLADATITVSEPMASLLPPACQARNHVVPHGVDLSRFDHLSRADARARLGWDPDESVVLFAADPRRHVKNFPLARAAVDVLTRRTPGVRLRVAHDLVPEDIPVWMAAADVLLLTSRSEGSPGVIKEAMAAGLPAVSTPVGDVPQLFRGVDGCYVRDPTPAALADGLVAALAHGAAPRAQEAVAALDVKLTAARVVGVYQWVLERTGNGRRSS
jgi:glycosyltransferase involved in cell wall biosynthesis